MRHQPLPIQSAVQRLMLGSGMAYAVVQVVILIYAGLVLLPLLGPPGGWVLERYEGYARHHALFKTGNYLMGLPIPFFFFFGRVVPVFQQGTRKHKRPLVGSLAAYANVVA
ncbi:MAG TPA: hypothetical protein VGN63_09215 [Flavisolibacter sp.]|jgi:hypothetical protein|nr:hypothetical protein [Flavisolibacter sp.]